MGIDQHGRAIDYLRISVTDRCNLRCFYCMPPEGVAWKDHGDILSIEEILDFVRISAKMGFKRIRLTGGEPLVRKGISTLVAGISETPGIERVAMTTNGILLPKFASELKEAGLSRVNISLDTLNPAQYTEITRLGHIEDVFAGIDSALVIGFNPVKINVVVVRSLQQDLLSFARMSIDRPLHIRFIEFMPVGDSSKDTGTGWTEEDTIANEELIDLINAQSVAAGLGRLEPLNTQRKPEGWGPARYFQFAGAAGTVGFISALSRHFCAECNRLRLTADGKLLPCLFSDLAFDARAALREGHEAGRDARLEEIISTALKRKPTEHHHRIGTKRKMSQIGG